MRRQLGSVAALTVVASLACVPTPAASAGGGVVRAEPPRLSAGWSSHGRSPHDRASSDRAVGWSRFSARPGAGRPVVQHGAVTDLVEVGETLVVGGTFRAVRNSGATTPTGRPYLVAVDEATGTVKRSFRPRLKGPVTGLAAGAGHTVYVAGDFSAPRGRVVPRVERLSVRTGRKVHGFHPPVFDDTVNDIVRSGHRVFVGGFFHRAGGRERRGLASLDTRTGVVTPVLKAALSNGAHPAGNAVGRPGARALAVTSGGHRLVVGGNFTFVGRSRRAQVAVLGVGRRAHVRKAWATPAFRPACRPAFDGYVRDVAMSPRDGYFVVTTTGGGVRGTLCDSVTRWPVRSTKATEHPSWVARTGGDTVLSADVTRRAIFVGGHQRWLNNPHGLGFAEAGAVPRPGLAALDPRTGLPLRWNPGRNPRGTGTQAILSTPAGLWVGSDTPYIGNRRYPDRRLAFFPAKSSRHPPTESAGHLPGSVVILAKLSRRPGSASSRRVRFDGSSVSSSTAFHDRAFGRTKRLRGAFEVGGRVFYGSSKGTLRRLTRHAGTPGPATVIDPYHDPRWRDVRTGTGDTTYDGADPRFAAELPRVTAMFYRAGRLYYTLRSSRALHWRAFSVDSGIVGERRHNISAGPAWQRVRGAFLVDHHLYTADRRSGRLSVTSWQARRPKGRPRVLHHAGRRWAARGLFVPGSGGHGRSGAALQP